MADVHSKATCSYNNLSRFSGWQPLKARRQNPKYWCENSYIVMATGTGYTIKNPGKRSTILQKPRVVIL